MCWKLKAQVEEVEHEEYITQPNFHCGVGAENFQIVQRSWGPLSGRLSVPNCWVLVGSTSQLVAMEVNWH